MRQRRAQQQLEREHGGALVPGTERGVRARGEKGHGLRRLISRAQDKVGAVDRVPGVEIRCAGHGQAVLPLEIAHGGGGLRAENAVRHERLDVALAALDAAQKGLQIENVVL